MLGMDWQQGACLFLSPPSLALLLRKRKKKIEEREKNTPFSSTLPFSSIPLFFQIQGVRSGSLWYEGKWHLVC